MKFSTTLSLGVAHLAAAKSVHNVAPVAKRNVASVNGVAASPVDLQSLQSLLGLTPGSGVSVNFLWVNLGGGQPTTVLNQAQTVTVTQTVAGAAATPPVAGSPGEVAASPTVVPGGGAGTPVAPGTGATHSVTVGGPQGLSFNPQVLRPAVGDTLVFTFLSQNHTVTQSAFETPCDPLAGGMDSGYQANPNNTVNPPPQVAMQVMVNTPLCKLPPKALRPKTTPNNIQQGSTAVKAPTAERAWSSPSTPPLRRRTPCSRPSPSAKRARAAAAPSPAVPLPLPLPPLLVLPPLLARLPRPLAPSPLAPPPTPRRTRASSRASALSTAKATASASCRASSTETSPSRPRAPARLAASPVVSPWGRPRRGGESKVYSSCWSRKLVMTILDKGMEGRDGR